MKTQVRILANSKTGQIVNMRTITDKQTGEIQNVGSVMVQSKTLAGFSGIARVQTRTAYVTLPEEALDMIGDQLIDGAVFPFDGKIVVEETLTPYIKKDGTKQEPKINPSTNEVITYQGQPVYRNTYFTEDLNAQDVFLKDSNVSTPSENSPE